MRYTIEPLINSMLLLLEYICINETNNGFNGTLIEDLTTNMLSNNLDFIYHSNSYLC